MPRINFETATLFTPGAASYVTTNPEGDGYDLNLSASSTNRAQAARTAFDPRRHTFAVFAGGYPGIQGWPEEQIPPLGGREADLMAMPLERRLETQGWNSEQIAAVVKRQGASKTSISDIALSMKAGFLHPDDFHQESDPHGLDLVTGILHGIRVASVLEVALDIPPELIRRVPTRDVWRTPATEFGKAVSPTVAVGKQVGGILLTKYALRGVKRGDADALLEVDEHLNKMISKSS